MPAHPQPTSIPVQPAPVAPQPTSAARSAIVIGVSGSPTSLAAVEYAARTFGDRKALYLVLALMPQQRAVTSRTAGSWCDALKSDAYLVEDRSVFHEIQRRARETAFGAGATAVNDVALEGFPYPVLMRTIRETDAPTLILGCRGRPSRLVRRCARASGCETVLVGADAAPMAGLTARPRHLRLAKAWQLRPVPEPTAPVATDLGSPA